MKAISELRVDALRLFEVGVDAADPAKALRAHINRPAIKSSPLGKVIFIAAGKAALPMMHEALKELPIGQKYEAIAVTNYENGNQLEGVRVLLAGHPVPDENGAFAAKEIIGILENADENDVVIALISGGASALLPAPVNDITLNDKIELNDVLLKAGFEITELNLVRQQLSRLKGGGMTRMAHPAKVTAYILSDVIGDDIRAIASGLTATPIGTRQDALSLLAGVKPQKKVPTSIVKYLNKTEAPQKNYSATNTIIGSNRKSLEAVKERAEQEGWSATIVSDNVIGDVDDAAHFIAKTMRHAADDERHCFIFGGETSVKVRGNGKGGRNQELAVRVAQLCRDLPNQWVFLSGGTDGRDGPTDAAGGIVDGQSVERMEANGIDLTEILDNNDSYRALNASGDLIEMGATGTNVADVQIALMVPNDE